MNECLVQIENQIEFGAGSRLQRQCWAFGSHFGRQRWQMFDEDIRIECVPGQFFGYIGFFNIHAFVGLQLDIVGTVTIVIRLLVLMHQLLICMLLLAAHRRLMRVETARCRRHTVDHVIVGVHRIVGADHLFIVGGAGLRQCDARQKVRGVIL